MPRQPSRKSDTPLDLKKKTLEAQAAALRAQIEKTRQFKERAPELRAKAQQREQNEIISRYHRPVSIEGPADYRYDLYAGVPAKPRKLRKERSKAPLLTVALLVTLVCVVYYAVRTLWDG